jgi:hypothetical protein
MLSAILSFFSIVPGITKLFEAWVGKAYDAKVAIKTAQIGGDVAVATTMVNADIVAQHERVAGLAVIAGSKVLLLIVLGFATPLIIYEWKVVVWDIVLKWGVTDSIRDPLIQSWTTTIIGCLFGSSTALTVGHMFFNRKNQ